MELLEGEELARLMEKEREAGGETPSSRAVKLGYILQVCLALEYAHKRQILHRDIRPSNILVTPEGIVKLVHFGATPFTNEPGFSGGMLTGSIDYMSPEQVRGEPVDARSDLWSAGVTMYEIFTHSKAFPAGDIAEVLSAIVSREPKPMREVRPDLPEELGAVLQRILKKQPSERYQTAGELLDDLDPIYRKMVLESGRATVTMGEALLLGTTQPDLRMLADSTRPRYRRPE